LALLFEHRRRGAPGNVELGPKVGDVAAIGRFVGTGAASPRNAQALDLRLDRLCAVDQELERRRPPRMDDVSSGA
jgi:hypothetical protein